VPSATDVPSSPKALLTFLNLSNIPSPFAGATWAFWFVIFAIIVSGSWGSVGYLSG
jgi:hypothetical protein